MIIPFPHPEDPYGIFRWLEANVGLYGHGWRIIYNETGKFEAMYHALDIESDEDSLAFKLTYGL